jgi:hypothetical protein
MYILQLSVVQTSTFRAFSIIGDTICITRGNTSDFGVVTRKWNTKVDIIFKILNTFFLNKKKTFPQDETSVSSSCLEDVKCKSTCSLQEEECHHYGPHLFKFWCFSSCIIYMLLFEKIQTFLIFWRGCTPKRSN